MQEANAVVVEARPESTTLEVPSAEETVSTHVLVGQDEVSKLRELSRRTRVAQSEYLREAVDDLLTKYDHLPENEEP
jgi:hypothetical protein